MKPLNVAELPACLASVYGTSALFREWIRLHEIVRRAEKISSWTEWTQDQRAAYRAGDYIGFSRMRGYSEEEIRDFNRFVALTAEVDQEQADAEFSVWANWEIQKLVRTEELDHIDAQLMDLSENHRP